VVFHLASVVSAGGERDFDLAVRVNLDGGRNVLEACRAGGKRPRLVFASTLAVFGGTAMPETVTDRTRPVPQTTYGATKAVCELLVNDYSRKGYLDGRSARLPTVIVRPGAPNEAASGFASAVFREPLAGRDYELPVSLETRMPVIGVRTAVECLIRLAELAGEVLSDDRTVTLPSISVTVGEMVDTVGRVSRARGVALGNIGVLEVPAITRIVRTWPRYSAAERALELGLPRDESLEPILADFLDTRG
jgi:nucleoside-diphosphate-sugar epimerase